MGEGDFGGVMGCMNSVKPVVDDIVMSEYWIEVIWRRRE